MIYVLVALLATNLLTLAVLLRRRRQAAASDGPVAADDPVAAALAPLTDGGPRRLISIEVLNPIELAESRGWVAGLAGTLAPGLTRRLVHDQLVKTLRRQLADQQVAATVRTHTL